MLILEFIVYGLSVIFEAIFWIFKAIKKLFLYIMEFAHKGKHAPQGSFTPEVGDKLLFKKDNSVLVEVEVISRPFIRKSGDDNITLKTYVVVKETTAFEAPAKLGVKYAAWVERLFPIS